MRAQSSFDAVCVFMRVGATLALCGGLLLGVTSKRLAAADEGGGTTGSVSVASDPGGAVVYVDGQYVGETPVSVSHLTPGDHRVRVDKPGYLENGRIITVGAGKAGTVHVRLTPRNAAAQDPAAASGLKIVVVSGEDGVNIVQKKTAVKPVVEVRDRNNVPVGGAAVKFIIQGGQNVADFGGGAREITLTTDSLGRATASSLRALGGGPFQIQVQATFQGQTATAAIAQSNFMTAAEAAEAGKLAASNLGSSSGSASGASSGAGNAAVAGGHGILGMSTPLFAAVAGGAAAATAGVAVAKRNHEPTIGGAVTATPNAGLLIASPTISFSAQASDPDNDPLTYTWDFGDGGSATGATASHTYNSAGTFTASVRVDDGRGGKASGSASVTIKTLTGTWRSSDIGSAVGTVTWVLSLSQSGATVTGTTPSTLGATGRTFPPGTIEGSVKSSSPKILLLLHLPGWLDSAFALDPNNADSLTGRWGDPSGNGGSTLTFTRQ